MHIPPRDLPPSNFPDPIYATDAYPREGCTVSIDVQKDGFRMQTFAPGGKLMEGYARAKTPRAMARMLEEWLSGFVPRISDRLDGGQDS
jgi:hypothetical protein